MPADNLILECQRKQYENRRLKKGLIVCGTFKYSSS